MELQMNKDPREVGRAFRDKKEKIDDIICQSAYKQHLLQQSEEYQEVALQ